MADPGKRGREHVSLGRTLAVLGLISRLFCIDSSAGNSREVRYHDLLSSMLQIEPELYGSKLPGHT